MHILLVEDHADLAATVEGYLSHLGHTVVRAADGQTAIERALGLDFDAVILDRKLPRVDGATVCRKLRAEAQEMPILMLTALDTLEDKLSGFEAGADDYLIKPFALAELHARLTSLHRRDSKRVQMVKVDTLSYDLVTREGSRGERPLTLSPTGKLLLETLLKAQGAIVSRAELEAALWPGEEKADGLLRVHMHAVRAAVDRGEAVPLIHTRPGSGYWLGLDGP